MELYWLQSSIREALETIPANQREVLALAYFKGYSQSEIAELLGVPLGTVKTRIRLAMQKLRLVLSQTMMEEPQTISRLAGKHQQPVFIWSLRQVMRIHILEVYSSLERDLPGFQFCQIEEG